jgi:medium-chain acyl-[acyl-carrier-protein] hydrolase
MKPVWEQNFVVSSYDVDPAWRLKLSSFFNYMQETAVNHSYDLNVGYHDLEKYGMFWVLSRIKLKIKKLPVWGETITVRTWPKGRDKLFALRDFVAINAQNEELINVTSLWLLVKKDNHKPLRMQSLGVTLPENEGKHALNEQLEKIKPLNHPVQVYEREVLVADLDVNYHVNNARYIEWILDCFEPSFLVSNKINAMQVNYIDEATYRDQIIMNMSNEASFGNHVHYIEAIHKQTKKTVVQAIIEWA